MRCPALTDLPAPPAGKTGWPWTVETPQLPALRPDGTPWPRISVVTASYNQGQFIEETIRSVLLQGYPDLEYIVVDGASTDGSEEFIRRYEPWLAGCIMEPDTGQPNAINKGFRLASGKLWQWINSDDLLLPSALETLGMAFRAEGQGLLAGNVINFGLGRTDEVAPNTDVSAAGLIRGLRGTRFEQPAIWFRGAHLRDLGGLDERYQYAFDWHILIRYLDKWPVVHYLNRNLAKFRFHADSKTVARQPCFNTERLTVLRNLLNEDIGARTLAHCKIRLSTQDWWEYLARARDEARTGAVPRYRVVASILTRALAQPQVRLTRFTAGAVKAIVVNRDEKPEAGPLA